MNEKNIQLEELWLELANLFFLDTEPDDADYERVAKLLSNLNWTSPQTFEFLVKHIAPICGANLGFLIYPAIGEWSSFEKVPLIENILKSIELRKKYPDWYFLVSDWWMRRMLKSLNFEKLEKAMSH